MDEGTRLEPFEGGSGRDDAFSALASASDEPTGVTERGTKQLAALGETQRMCREFGSIFIDFCEKTSLPLGELTQFLRDACPKGGSISTGGHKVEDTFGSMSSEVPHALPDPLVDALLAPKPTFSFEFFPPKDDEGEALLWSTIADLESLEPTFVSVTYGAGGTSQERTVRVTERIAQESSMVPVGHLTLVDQSRDDLELVLKQYASAGVKHVLALRGDPTGGPRAPWQTHPGGLEHAIELVDLAHQTGDFSVGVAAFPEGHPDARDRDHDAHVLVAKANAGARFAITQLFFRASDYVELVERVSAQGSDIPIVPGIMPILNYGQVARMAELSGAAIPAEVLEYIEPVIDDPAEVRRRGVELATQLCRDVIAAGAPGLHFITLNRSKASREILETLKGEGLL